ncbi:MAG: winged helix-turn-helix transcriptional regulator [Candidatus Methanomarinus sp.]|uniref:Winged helix-turn-helix transcriptional regulator n=1 Tax=Candidatus Methanomarinus sp. TaxID=3386244 RepID=A0AC61SB18_9EURY|nr:MAG: winged helix-turn-helix transcriptional regulator [ANME-2 cluster archaeon]
MEYLEVVVEPYPYPVSYKGQYHYRSGSTKQELKGAALDKFLLQKQGKRWDGVPVPNISIKDLDNNTFELFRKKATKSGRLSEEVLGESNKILIENLRLKDGDYLKRAAILLFHPDPEKYVTGAYIKIGFFRTDDDLLYQDEIHGNLLEQVDRTLDLLLTKYMRANISYEDMTRIEKYPFPRSALREALLNAVVHKDYSNGVPIQISVYDNKVVLWNDGQLPEGWTIEKLKQKHPSNPYNPDIANAFFRAGSIEAWGRGIQKITSECQIAGLPVPEYKYDFSGFFLEFKQSNYNVPEETSVKTSVKILEAIKSNDRITIPELAETIGVTTRSIERNIQNLQQNGKLVRIGPDKGGHWKIIGG